MEQNFEKGDVVQLKSGGPAMTVVALPRLGHVNGYLGEVKCIWFPEPFDKCKEEMFLQHTLKKVYVDE